MRGFGENSDFGDRHPGRVIYHLSDPGTGTATPWRRFVPHLHEGGDGNDNKPNSYNTDNPAEPPVSNTLLHVQVLCGALKRSVRIETRAGLGEMLLGQVSELMSRGAGREGTNGGGIKTKDCRHGPVDKERSRKKELSSLPREIRKGSDAERR